MTLDDKSGRPSSPPALDRLVESIWTRLLSRGSMIAVAAMSAYVGPWLIGAIRDFNTDHQKLAQTIALLQQKMETDRDESKLRIESLRLDIASDFKLRDFRLDQHDRNFTEVNGRLGRLELLPVPRNP